MTNQLMTLINNTSIGKLATNDTLFEPSLSNSSMVYRNRLKNPYRFNSFTFVNTIIYARVPSFFLHKRSKPEQEHSFVIVSFLFVTIIDLFTPASQLEWLNRLPIHDCHGNLFTPRYDSWPRPRDKRERKHHRMRHEIDAKKATTWFDTSLIE
jgi:hypothetical protein